MPPGADLGLFLISDGKVTGKPVPKPVGRATPLSPNAAASPTLGFVIGRREERPGGVNNRAAGACWASPLTPAASTAFALRGGQSRPASSGHPVKLAPRHPERAPLVRRRPEKQFTDLPQCSAEAAVDNHPVHADRRGRLQFDTLRHEPPARSALGTSEPADPGATPPRRSSEALLSAWRQHFRTTAPNSQYEFVVF